MKPVMIIGIVFVLLIPPSVFAQEESLSELTARLDAENLQKAKEAGSIVNPSSPNVQQQTLEKINCPSGYIERATSGGEITCVNEITGQKLDNSTVITLDESSTYIIAGVFIFIIIIAVIAKASQSKSSSDSYKDVERKQFTPNTKERVKELQHARCADCGKIPTHWEFDHIDTRGDNSIENCQGLCLDCHQSKTRKDDWSNTRD